MQIAYKLTAEDWVHFQEYYTKKKAPLAGCLQPLIAITLIGNVLFGAYLYFQQGVTTYTYVCLVCILLLGFLLIIRGQSKKNMLKAAKQMEKDKPGAFGDMTMNFDKQGVDIKSSTNSKHLNWDEVDSYNSDKTHYYIFSKKGMVYIIPKRDINSEEEFRAVLDEFITV